MRRNPSTGARKTCPALELLHELQWYLDAQAEVLPDLAAMAAGRRGMREAMRLIGEALAAERVTPRLAQRLSRVYRLLSGLEELNYLVDPADPRMDDLCRATERLQSFAMRINEMVATGEATAPAALRPAA